MTKRLWIWAFLWILSLVGISFFGGVISYGFFALMTIIPVVALIYLLMVFSFFRIYQKTDSVTLVAGEPAGFFFTLVNEVFFVFTGVRVRFFSAFSTINGLDDSIEYELTPGTGITKETTLVCKYRGEYEVGIDKVEITDFFRLFMVSYHNRETMRVTVMPKLVYLDSIKSADISHVFREKYNMKSIPDVLSRPYEEGDDIRRINWYQTARTGEIMVRGQIGEEKPGIGIVTDTKRYSDKMEEYIPSENKILETVLALGLFAANKGIETTEFHGGSNTEAGNAGSGRTLGTHLSGLKDFDAFYKYISAISFDKDYSLQGLLDALSGNSKGVGCDLLSCSMVFMVLGKWSGEAAILYDELAKAGIYTMVYLIDDGNTTAEPGRKTKETGDCPDIPGNTYLRIPTDCDLREVL